MIREANEKDLDTLLQLYLFLHEDHIPEYDEHLHTTWKQMLEDQNHHIILCEVDGVIVSSCICVIIPNLTRDVRPYAFIENVVTREESRGKGYATQCLMYAKRIAEDNKCYKMMLMTGSKRQSTLDFYSRAGFNSGDKTAFVQWLP